MSESRLAVLQELPTIGLPHEIRQAIWPKYACLAVCIGFVTATAAAYLLLDDHVAAFWAPFRHTFFTATVSRLSVLGLSAWYLVPAAAVYLACRRRFVLLASRAAFLFMSVGMAGIITDVMKLLVGRPRPSVFLEQGDKALHWFASSSLFQSFPSGHASTFTAVAMAFGLIYPRYLWRLLVAGVVLSLLRTVSLQHFLSDAIAGMGLGVLAAWWMSHYFMSRETNRDA